WACKLVVCWRAVSVKEQTAGNRCFIGIGYRLEQDLSGRLHSAFKGLSNELNGAATRRRDDNGGRQGSIVNHLLATAWQSIASRNRYPGDLGAPQIRGG